MENIEITNIPNFPAVSIKPDKTEKREIRKRYLKAGLVIVINVVLFNYILRWIIMLACGIYAGGLSSGSINIGINALYSNPVLSTLVSAGIPITSEVISIIVGFKLFKIDIKTLLGRDNYTSGTIIKLVVLSLGLQTAAALLATIFATFFDLIGVSPDLPDLSVDLTSPWSNVLLYTYACIIGPVLEELLYRGFLLHSLRKYNERMAIFISALIFGLMHENYQQFILGFLIGIPLAIVTIKCSSLIPAIITHIFVNTTATLTSLFMAYYAPEDYMSIINGDINLGGLSSEMVTIAVINAIFRYGAMLAALIIGITALAKGKNMSKPTPAGKSRGIPLLFTSLIWIVIFGYYIVINFIEPFM